MLGVVQQTSKFHSMLIILRLKDEKRNNTSSME